MKKASRHAPPEKAAPKPRKKRVSSASKKVAKTEKNKFTAPIFNTRYAGMPYTYIRPFDPVWPTDEPEN
jgi:hypothetical protein